MAVIGWDPDKNHIVSWGFNLLGTTFSYYQGKNEQGRWVKASGRMPDGATIEFSGLHSLVEENTMEYAGSRTFTKEGNKIPVTLGQTAKRINR